MIEAWTQRPLFRARENRQSTSYNLSPILRSIPSSTLCYEGVKISRLLHFRNQIPFYFYLGHLGHLDRSFSSDRYLFYGKRPVAIAARNTELPLFMNGVHNSKSVSTIDRVITPLTIFFAITIELCFRPLIFMVAILLLSVISCIYSFDFWFHWSMQGIDT